MRNGEMNGHARQREWANALAVVVNEQTGRERYRRRQRQVRRGRTGSVEHPRPLEFDENGFPIPQRTPTFVTRVARLLRPS
jgi:hypothetical protein